MRSSLVFLFVFLVVAKDALHAFAGERTFVHMWVRCKAPDDKERAKQTIEVRIGEEKDGVFTNIRNYTSEEDFGVGDVISCDPALLVAHFLHACPYGGTKKETVLRPVKTNPQTYDWGDVML